MKAMLERSLPIQQAFLRPHMGETHHVQRLVEEKDAVILAYGPESQEEKDLFRRLVERNRRNMSFKSYQVIFCREEEVQDLSLIHISRWARRPERSFQ